MTFRFALAVLLFLIVPRAIGSDPYNYAALWQSWGDVTRDAYIDGAVDGISRAFIRTLGTVAPKKMRQEPTPPDVKAVVLELFVRNTRSQVRDVMTELYKDPANGFIGTLDVFFLARDKIEGKDITRAVREARKQAIDTHELNEKMRTK